MSARDQARATRFRGEAHDLPVVLDARDVAQILGITERRGLALMSSGALGATSRVGGRTRILRDVFFSTLGGAR